MTYRTNAEQSEPDEAPLNEESGGWRETLSALKSYAREAGTHEVDLAPVFFAAWVLAAFWLAVLIAVSP